MQRNRNELTNEEKVTLSNIEGEEGKDETEAKPIIDQTMEETSRHQINSETNDISLGSIDGSALTCDNKRRKISKEKNKSSR